MICTVHSAVGGYVRARGERFPPPAAQSRRPPDGAPTARSRAGRVGATASGGGTGWRSLRVGRGGGADRRRTPASGFYIRRRKGGVAHGSSPPAPPGVEAHRPEGERGPPPPRPVGVCRTARPARTPPLAIDEQPRRQPPAPPPSAPLHFSLLSSRISSCPPPPLRHVLSLRPRVPLPLPFPPPLPPHAQCSPRAPPRRGSHSQSAHPAAVISMRWVTVPSSAVPYCSRFLITSMPSVTWPNTTCRPVDRAAKERGAATTRGGMRGVGCKHRQRQQQGKGEAPLDATVEGC